MGFQDALYKQRIAYASEQAVEFADISMEMISYYAISASNNLAEERGRYESYKGSLWDQGILPIDSLKKLLEIRGSDYLDANLDQRLDLDQHQDQHQNQHQNRLWLRKNLHHKPRKSEGLVMNVANGHNHLWPLMQLLLEAMKCY